MADWRVTARLDPARWVAWDGATWTADPATGEEFALLPDGPHGPAPMTPVGPFYTPTSPIDPVALLLNAASLLPGGLVLTGEAPELPAIPAVPEGALA